MRNYEELHRFPVTQIASNRVKRDKPSSRIAIWELILVNLPLLLIYRMQAESLSVFDIALVAACLPFHSRKEDSSFSQFCFNFGSNFTFSCFIGVKNSHTHSLFLCVVSAASYSAQATCKSLSNLNFSLLFLALICIKS